MTPTPEFKKTAKQVAAVKLMGSTPKYLLLVGGSRSGKTFIIMRQIFIRALKVAGSRHLCVRFAFNHAKQSLWYDTIPKVLELCFPGVKPNFNKSDWFLEFPNGSQVWVGGLDDKERTEKILGNEYTSIFLNEASQISYDSFTLVLTRLAQNTALANKIYVDCNPPSTKHWIYQFFVMKQNPVTKDKLPEGLYDHMIMNPDDNLENLPEDYISSVLGTLSHRQQKRFRYGEFVDDVEGALWSYELIDKNRVNELPEFKRIVVAVDPSGSGKQGSDEAGIIVTGLGFDGHGYVLEDRSGVMTPNQWGSMAVRLYHKWNADRMVAEVNQGWDMVEAVIRNIEKNISLRKISASRGKIARAEPVVALYEQGKVHHVGSLPGLEDEMTGWDATEATMSPGRIDALVYGLSEMMVKNVGEFVLV
jgi:phage terminase large subunit-like protein